VELLHLCTMSRDSLLWLLVFPFYYRHAFGYSYPMRKMECVSEFVTVWALGAGLHLSATRKLEAKRPARVQRPQHQLHDRHLQHEVHGHVVHPGRFSQEGRHDVVPLGDARHRLYVCMFGRCWRLCVALSSLVPRACSVERDDLRSSSFSSVHPNPRAPESLRSSCRALWCFVAATLQQYLSCGLPRKTWITSTPGVSAWTR